MASGPKHFITPEEYLTQERKAETRSEYWNGQTFPMEAATRNHARISTDVVGILQGQLRTTQCNAYSSDLRVHIPATGLYTYPDIVVTCGEERFLDQEQDTLLNPVLIIEVVSPSTEDYDRGRKFVHYRSIPSLREYVTIAQDAILVERHVRQGDKDWLLTEHRDALAAIKLGSLPVAVSLHIGDIYEKVNWPPR